MLLSERMKAVAGLVRPCKSVADIGCDHGYVAVELVQRKVCRHVIAMDIHEGPLQRAKRTVWDCGLQEDVEIRLSDGTQALCAGEADGMICAGMGGKLIISILEQGMELVRQMRQIILQPQSDISEVRRYLREHGFLIEQEDMVYEDGKYYPMMRALPKSYGGREELPEEDAGQLLRVQDAYGPCLLGMSHPVLKQYLLHRKETLDRIRDQLRSQDQPAQRQQNRMMQLDIECSDVFFCLCHYFIN